MTHRFEASRVTVFVEPRTAYIGNLGPMVGISYPLWEDAAPNVRNIEYMTSLGIDGIDEHAPRPVHRLHPDQEGCVFAPVMG